MDGLLVVAMGAGVYRLLRLGGWAREAAAPRHARLARHRQHRRLQPLLLLRTIEDVFGLPHFGDAAVPQVRSFGTDVFG